jgi:hypothetical protein
VDAGIQREVSWHYRLGGQVDDIRGQDAEELCKHVEPAETKPLHECRTVGGIGSAELGKARAVARGFAGSGWIVTGRKKHRKLLAKTGESSGLSRLLRSEGWNGFGIVGRECGELVHVWGGHGGYSMLDKDGKTVL